MSGFGYNVLGFGSGGGAAPFEFTVSSNTTDANIRTLADAAGYSGRGAIIMTVNSSVYIYSTDTSTPALTIEEDDATVINNGNIIGKGSNGATDRAAGGAGGKGINITSSGVTITNASGAYIAGGGGGGGSAAFINNNGNNSNSGGGGGAGGGSGGNGVGSTGQTQYGGAGGGVGASGANGTKGTYGYAGNGGGAGGDGRTGGTGGNGGQPGEPGTAGTDGLVGETGDNGNTGSGSAGTAGGLGGPPGAGGDALFGADYSYTGTINTSGPDITIDGLIVGGTQI